MLTRLSPLPCIITAMAECHDCDGQGFKFAHRDGDVFMEQCQTCSATTLAVEYQGTGFRGFWIDLSWAPNAQSPPGATPWKVRLIEEIDGRVKLTPLAPAQLHQLCGAGKNGLNWLAIISATSELARLQREVETLTQAVRKLEARRGLWDRIVSFTNAVLGRR